MEEMIMQSAMVELDLWKIFADTQDKQMQLYF